MQSSSSCSRRFVAQSSVVTVSQSSSSCSRHLRAVVIIAPSESRRPSRAVRVVPSESHRPSRARSIDSVARSRRRDRCAQRAVVALSCRPSSRCHAVRRRAVAPSSSSRRHRRHAVVLSCCLARLNLSSHLGAVVPSRRCNVAPPSLSSSCRHYAVTPLSRCAVELSESRRRTVRVVAVVTQSCCRSSRAVALSSRSRSVAPSRSAVVPSSSSPRRPVTASCCRTLRVAPFESHRPSRAIRVALSESRRPRRAVRVTVAPSESRRRRTRAVVSLPLNSEKSNHFILPVFCDCQVP